MTIIEIENNLNTLISNFNKETFIFDLLLAYGAPKSTIKRLVGSHHDKLASHGDVWVESQSYLYLLKSLQNSSKLGVVVLMLRKYVIISNQKKAYFTKQGD
jgi:hypothetical protein